MFTPELVAKDNSEYVLVANHNFGNDEARNISISFMKSRVDFGRTHIPNGNSKFRIIYDLRGQMLPADIENWLQTEFLGICNVEVKKTELHER
jgi:hypothetical protein